MKHNSQSAQTHPAIAWKLLKTEFLENILESVAKVIVFFILCLSMVGVIELNELLLCTIFMK